eukprot:CAMPEP_0203657650 /NCGR_PEP_ID=MMETSP0088-20131115/45567_1 /ASSEMBLY_ACC=CAM_ASM_001087 /TAXON_ID=426623 /ORGANISM="Chaetoceros affinis, Strain CCMP159" /LENGTH=458 /DNA_ID=CAMNT_0050519055 /DNA_START=148 /DNA_END=1525 /DNA_ORIENTATION=+
MFKAPQEMHGMQDQPIHQGWGIIDESKLKFQHSIYFIDLAQPSPSTPISPRNRSTYSIHRERYHHNNYQTTPIKKQPPPAEPIPLPIPKNHVLISLMEAAERRKVVLMDESSDSDADEYDDAEHVLNAIDVLSSDCGTYVVRDNEGLAIFENNPYDLTLKKVPSYLKPPPMLRYGQKVQVVSIENGVHKLARNEGYLIADDAQLVKVGMPFEKSCEIEGMLKTVQSSKANLAKEMVGLEEAEKRLESQLSKILKIEPEHPIIEDFQPFEMDQENKPEHESLLDETLNNKQFEIGLSLSEESLIGTPTPASPPGTSNTLSRQVLFISDEVESGTPISDTVSESGIHVRRSVSPHLRGNAFMCGGSFFPILHSASDDDERERRRLGRVRPRRGGRADMEDIQPIRSVDVVDFRTGLSGHIALNKRKKKATPFRRNEVRQYEHRGIAPIRTIRRNLTDSPH